MGMASPTDWVDSTDNNSIWTSWGITDVAANNLVADFVQAVDAELKNRRVIAGFKYTLAGGLGVPLPTYSTRYQPDPVSLPRRPHIHKTIHTRRTCRSLSPRARSTRRTRRVRGVFTKLLWKRPSVQKKRS